MINKQTKVLAIVLAILLSGVVGFALFSQQLEINGTAKAEGKFEITATCTPGISEEFANSGLVSEDVSASDLAQEISDLENGYENSKCTVNGTTVNFSTDIVKPEGIRLFTVKLTNTGSIPATLSGDISTDDLVDKKNFTYNGEAEANDGSKYKIIDNKIYGYTEDGEYTEFWEMYNSDALTIGPIFTDAKDGYMAPGESMYLIYIAQFGTPTTIIPITVNGVTEKFESPWVDFKNINISTNYSYTFNFVQYSN